MSDYALSLLRGAYFGTLIGALAFFLLWEGGAPRLPFADAASRRRHLLRNLTMFALVVVIADLVVGIGLLGTSSQIGATPPGLLAQRNLEWPAQLVIGVLAVDLLYYWWHRACHAVPWLWRLHRVHHSDPHLDATTGTRFHPLEVSLSIVLVVGALKLLGIPLWVELARTLVVNPLVLAQHANVVFPPWLDRAARPLLVTPELHWVHHSSVRAEHNANYGQLFSIWDRWFGTYQAPPASTTEVGVAGLESEHWQTVTGMMATPFRETQ